MGGIVWILGAGFSKALGGPMLPQLLSTPSRAKIRSRFKAHESVLFGRDDTALRKLLDYGRGWEQSKATAFWADAEEFLEFLDLAATGGPTSAQRKLLVAILGDEYATDGRALDLAAVAKHQTAAECCFYEESDLAYEKWLPYLTWASQLTAEDTVITFNYDCVVESVAAKAGRRMDVCLSGSPKPDGATRLLKLHGSVDWRTKADGEVVQTARPDFAVSCPNEELSIASPGPSKARFTQRMTTLWELAHQTISHAASIVFVGYRFPPSDAISRERLLTWISENKRLPELSIHTVLGPGSDATPRLKALLDHAARRGGRRSHREPPVGEPLYYELIPHPLYAEDFIGRVTREALTT